MCWRSFCTNIIPAVKVIAKIADFKNLLTIKLFSRESKINLIFKYFLLKKQKNDNFSIPQKLVFLQKNSD